MPEKVKKNLRGQVGYGSSYKKGTRADMGSPEAINSVLNGQVWLVKPDKEIKIENPCIWMAAGVVKNKNCNNYYDCVTCKYDAGMQKQVEKGKLASWQDAMRRRPALDRLCRHSLTNRIGNRVCAYDFQCATCDFDQFFEDVWSPKTKSLPYGRESVKGFDVAMGYYYHNGHTWARIESGGYIRIGLDDFALKLLGRPDALELPLIGKELDQGKAGWGFKREDNLADVLSPIDGVIVEVNSDIRENPRKAGREPYGEGWLFLVSTPNIKASVKNLMSDTGTLGWINEEVRALEGMIEETAGPLATDGGYLGQDIYGNLPDLGWKRLTKTFLRS